MNKQRILIMGAAGRDFHNFNTYFRGNDNNVVVRFKSDKRLLNVDHFIDVDKYY